MLTPLAEVGRAASEWRERRSSRPDHGALVLAFYRIDTGQGVDMGQYSAARDVLVIQKATNTVLENKVEIVMPWRYYSQWAYVWFPPQDKLTG